MRRRETTRPRIIMLWKCVYVGPALISLRAKDISQRRFRGKRHFPREFFLTLSSAARIQTGRGLRAAAPLPANQSARRHSNEEKGQERRYEEGWKEREVAAGTRVLEKGRSEISERPFYL